MRKRRLDNDLENAPSRLPPSPHVGFDEYAKRRACRRLAFFMRRTIGRMRVGIGIEPARSAFASDDCRRSAEKRRRRSIDRRPDGA